MKTYEICLKPLNGHTLWPTKNLPEQVLPPRNRRMSGRPNVRRHKGKDEEKRKNKNDNVEISRVGRIIHCKICGGEGQNKITCPLKNNPPPAREGVSNQSGRPRGRPRGKVVGLKEEVDLQVLGAGLHEGLVCTQPQNLASNTWVCRDKVPQHQLDLKIHMLQLELKHLQY